MKKNETKKKKLFHFIPRNKMCIPFYNITLPKEKFNSYFTEKYF